MTYIPKMLQHALFGLSLFISAAMKKLTIALTIFFSKRRSQTLNRPNQGMLKQYEYTQLIYLNGLRGLAALVVVLSHMFYGFYPALHTGHLDDTHTIHGIELLIAKSPLNIVYNGHYAVCVFFVLSGYVITASFFQTGNPVFLIKNTMKRYPRLAIPVLFSVSLSYVLMTLNLFYNQKTVLITHSVNWLNHFWTFNPNLNDMLSEGIYKVFFDGTCTYNRVLWTMTYEFFGSFLTFATAALIGKVRYRFWLYFLMILITLHTYYFLFILGLCLSDFFQGGQLKKTSHPLVIGILLLVGLLLGSYPNLASVDHTLYQLFLFSWLNNPPLFYHGIGALFMLLSLSLSVTMQRLLSNTVFVFLGKISFSLYLIHLIGLCSFSCYVFVHLVRWCSYFSAFMITLLLSLCLFFTVALLMFQYVDQLGMNLAKKMYFRHLRIIV